MTAESVFGARRSTMRASTTLEAEAIFIMREVAAEFERPGAAVLGREGFDRPPATGGEGILAGENPVPRHARGYGPQLPGGHRVP